MMHRAWSSIVEVPYCFSRPHVKFQGHTALKIVEFDPNWAFPDSNSSLNSPMAMKCCTKLETAKERCPIVFQGHPSNFKVTRDKTSPILTQVGRFRTIGRSQLSNPSDLPCSWIIHNHVFYKRVSVLSRLFFLDVHFRVAANVNLNVSNKINLYKLHRWWHVYFKFKRHAFQYQASRAQQLLLLLHSTWCISKTKVALFYGTIQHTFNELVRLAS